MISNGKKTATSTSSATPTGHNPKSKTESAKSEKKNNAQGNKLDDACNDLEIGRQTLLAGLDLLDNSPQQLYQAGSDKARTTLNKAIFTKLYLDQEQQPNVIHDDLAEPFTTVL